MFLLFFAGRVGREGKNNEKSGYCNSANILDFFQTQVEVALAAADGDLNVAVEILMSQQVFYIEIIAETC